MRFGERRLAAPPFVNWRGSSASAMRRSGPCWGNVQSSARPHPEHNGATMLARRRAAAAHPVGPITSEKTPDLDPVTLTIKRKITADGTGKGPFKKSG